MTFLRAPPSKPQDLKTYIETEIMKKYILFFALSLPAIAAWAQTPDETNIDWNEDEVVSINDIMGDKRVANNATTSTSHFKKVWRRKTYVDLGMNNSTLTPITAGSPVADAYKSSWGATFQNGRSFNLHRHAIGQVLRFSLDWSWFDLMFNHYDATTSIGTPVSEWDYEKYEFHAGMNIGPSITIAPFTHIKNAKGLHHLKFNAYYHVGYTAAGVFLNEKKDEKKDNKLFDTEMLLFGHGMTTSFGASMNWKALGVGFEIRNAKGLNFKLIEGEKDYLEREFDASTNRLFIQFRI